MYYDPYAKPPPSYSPYPAGAPPSGPARQIKLSWRPARNGEIPPQAIQAGPGRFVARAFHAGGIVPGKAATGHRSAFVPYGGVEHSVNEYEVLCESTIRCTDGHCGYEWVPSSNGSVPGGAIIAGHTENGNEPLYIGRATISGEWCVGKVYPPHGCAYMPYGGTEHRVTHYDVLIAR